MLRGDSARRNEIEIERIEEGAKSLPVNLDKQHWFDSLNG